MTDGLADLESIIDRLNVFNIDESPTIKKARKTFKLKKPSTARIKENKKDYRNAKQASAKQSRELTRIRKGRNPLGAKAKFNKQASSYILEKPDGWYYKGFEKHWFGPFKDEKLARIAYDVHETRWYKHYEIESDKFEDFLKSIGYDGY